MIEKTRTTFGSLGELFDGPHATPTRRHEGPYFLNIAGLDSGRLDLSACDHVSDEEFAKWTRRVTPQADDLLFSYETRLGDAALMPEGVTACLGRRMALLRPNTSAVDPRFLLYFYLSPTFQRTIAENTIQGATVSRIGLATMPDWEVDIPALPTQRAIAEVLGALDDKIAANDRVQQIQDSLMAATYESGLAAGSIQNSVDEIAEFHNRYRIPLSSRERDSRKGTVPYYGANGVLDHVDESIFDHSLVLVGEDGSVVQDDGRAIVNYIWGKSWINNHAHALTGKYFSTEMLKFAISRPTVTHLVTGAVQPKISMGKLRTLIVDVPRNIPPVDDKITNMMSSWRAVAEESRLLAKTRDELLPLLMSGKLRVRDAEKTVEEVT